MVFWISTGLVAAFLIASSASYIFHEPTIKGVRELGFPDYFRIQLAILKPIAAATLLIPSVPLNFKEWAYAGTGFFFLTAIVAHYAHKDPWVLNLVNVALVILLTLSYVTWQKV